MNIFEMVNSISKLKAAVCAIIGNNNELLHKSTEIYFRNALVVSDTEEEDKISAARTPFRKFLQRDERHEMGKKLTFIKLTEKIKDSILNKSTNKSDTHIV